MVTRIYKQVHIYTPMKRCEIEEVLRLLSIGKTKQEIKKILSLKSSALSNHLRRLENLGCIERKDKFITNVLSSSHLHPKVSKNQVHIKLNKRGHAFNFKILFPNEKNLQEREKVRQEEKQGKFEKLKFGTLKFSKDGNTIWINKGSLTIYSNNSYYSDNALHSKFKALKEIDNLVIQLKDRFGFTGIYGIEVFREHYGLIFNQFAQWILKGGRKMYAKDNKNKTVLWVDNSRKDDIGMQEFEGENPISINRADNFFVSQEKTGWKVTPEFVLDAFGQQVGINKQFGEQINKVTENQMIFAENMKSHISAIQELARGVHLLTDKVEKLGDNSK